MQVLVVESEPGAAAVAIDDLEQAGHAVHRCHAPGAAAFPCAALDPDGCPLESDEIDVVLTVRSSSGRQPSPLEDGITCALRRHVPVVVAGRTAVQPFEGYEVTVARTDDVVAACEQARDTLTMHRAIARDALVTTLGRAGIDTEAADAEVTRREGRLRAHLIMPDATPTKVQETASVRVTGALRAFDRYAGGIDVSCTLLPGG